MCGIAGIIDFEGRPIERPVLDRFCNALAHRGPDDRGTVAFRAGPLSVGLAHTRLAVLDPTPAGHQPMTDPARRFWVVFNGEIYNFRELRVELEAAGCSFRTACDTELVLAAYARWGTEAFSKFNGMWALVLVDAHTGRGVLARDRFGIKPLYYLQHDGRLVFASEMQALATLRDWPRRIDPVGLAYYLHYGYIPHPHSIWQDVRKLAPGTLMRFDATGPGPPERFYDLPVPDGDAPPFDQAAAELRRRLGSAVAARRIADVPLGALLSGGIDSSIVVAHLAAAGNGPVRTFSIGYADQPRYDETSYARLVARRFGTEHHEIKLTFEDVIAILPAVLDRLAEPFADSSLLPTALLSRYTRQHVTVALSGDGADELFGGYWRYLGHYYWARYRDLPGALRKGLIEPALRAAPVAKASAWTDRLRQARKLLRTAEADPFERHIAWSAILAPEARRILNDDGRRELPVEAMRALFRNAVPQPLQRAWAGDSINAILAIDLALALPADMLHKIDLASMAYGLEVRVPMLDPAVVEFAAALPSRYKIDGRSRKRILIAAHRDLLPPAVLRHRKMGFEVPIGEFLRNRLREMFLDIVRKPVVAALGWLDYEGIMQTYKEHCARRGEYADLLYGLLVLCWWQSRWAGSRMPDEPGPRPRAGSDGDGLA